MSFALKNTKKAIKFLLQKKSLSSPMPFLIISDSDTPVISPIGVGILKTDGHPMTNPLHPSWCVNDTYPNNEGIRELMIFNYDTQERFDLGQYKRLFAEPEMSLKQDFFRYIDKHILSTVSENLLSFTRSGLHCDLHPRWTYDGKRCGI